MIDAKQLPTFKQQVGNLENQLGMFKAKIEEAPEIKPGEEGPEEERARLLTIINNQQKKLSEIVNKVESTFCKNENKKIDPSVTLDGLQMLDENFRKLENDIGTIIEDQYECKLEVFKKEIFKSVDLILGSFDFIIPSIRFEVNYIKKYYRKPSNMVNTIIPEVIELVQKVEEHEITLKEFFDGYGWDNDRTLGYRELREKKKLFSRYQFFENPPESYKELNDIYSEICQTMEVFLKDKRSEQELGKLYLQMTDKKILISRMSEIFDIGSFLTLLFKKTRKKYSYTEEVRKIGPLLEQYNKLRKDLVNYNETELAHTRKALETKLAEPSDKNRLNAIMEEADRYIKEGNLSFDQLDMIFGKLFKNDFNIIIQEKEPDDITITITPHHEKKYGRDVLNRFNIIIHEIDFWYPPDNKQLLFQYISGITSKIQADEVVDIKEFKAKMLHYDQAIETNIRKMYPNKVEELIRIHSAFKSLFPNKAEKERLENRVGNKNIWKEIQEYLETTGKNIAVLSSDSAALKENVNKFIFFKTAVEQMSQVLYDLAMQKFVLFGVDGKSITNMTIILSTYNEYHDLASLWAAFSYYLKKNNIPSMSVNEKIMCQWTKEPRCKARLNTLGFSEIEEKRGSNRRDTNRRTGDRRKTNLTVEKDRRTGSRRDEPRRNPADDRRAAA